MKTNIKNINKEPALIVWTGSSKIWKSIASSLINNFDLITTSRYSNDLSQLNILDLNSINNFIKSYLDKFWKKPINTIFLNSWFMNIGDTIDCFNFYKRSNNWDSEINIHLNNVVLLERLHKAWIISSKTKVIYNASVQIIDGKKGYEDYAFMKKLVSSLILNDDRWDATILCASLIKWTAMSKSFKEQLDSKSKEWFKTFLNKNMPYGQPSLMDINHAVKQILLHKNDTRWKLVFVDWWSIINNKPDSIDDNFLFYNRKEDKLIPYKNLT